MGHLQGPVQIRVALGADGAVLAAKALAGEPWLRKAAEARIRGLRFKPVLVQGKPAAVLTDLALPFTLKGVKPEVPGKPVTGYVLHVEMEGKQGPCPLDSASVEREVRARLEQLGLAEREPGIADPQTTMDLTVQVNAYETEDHLVIGRFASRASLLADRKLEQQQSAEPNRVWYASRIFCCAGEERGKDLLALGLDQLTGALLEGTDDPFCLKDSIRIGDGPIAEATRWQPEPSVKVKDFDFSQIRVKLQPPPPAYPPLAKIDRIQGTVVVEVTVDATGIPNHARGLEGPEILQAAAVPYALRWRFHPALVDGVPQASRFRVTMTFRLH